MTTIVGIRTNTDLDAVVLASDTQMNLFDEKGKPYGKKPFYKITYGSFWALAHVGAVTDEVRTFYNKLSKSSDEEYAKKVISTAVETQRCMEVDALNSKYYKRTKDDEDLIEFLLAINKPKIELYHIDFFGNLRPHSDDQCPFMVFGTSEKEVNDYLLDKFEGETYDSANINIKTALTLCRMALKRAEGDIYSGGPMDITVVRDEGVFSHSRSIRKALENAEDSEFERIVNEEISRKK